MFTYAINFFVKATEEEFYFGPEVAAVAAVSVIFLLAFIGVESAYFKGFFRVDGSAVLLILFGELLIFGLAFTLLRSGYFNSLYGC